MNKTSQTDFSFPYLTGKRFLVIGGAGFIGSHLTDLLIRQGAASVTVFDNLSRGRRENLPLSLGEGTVSLVKGDISRRAELESAFDEEVDYVFHLAAVNLADCEADPALACRVNVEGTANVLDLCVRKGVKKIVFSSSASVYGEATYLPMDENHPFNNQTVYGATKIAGEEMLKVFHRKRGLPYVALRYMNVYGPRQDDRGTYVGVIIKMLQKIDRGEPLEVFGDGSATYDFVYVEDVAEANLRAMVSPVDNGAFNVGTGVATSVRSLSENLLRTVERPELTIRYRRDVDVPVTHRVGDPRHADQVLNFRYSIELTSGLRQTVDWWSHGRNGTC